MRDFLTGLAIILIVVLTTVLVAPYFVDWNGQRAFLEARLSHALGQKVTVGGTIDLKLLPTPYLVLDQVVVGGDDGPLQIGIHHLDLELTVAPLLHGEFDIVEARLEQPTIRINLQRDRLLPVLPAAPAFQADVRFDRIQVSDGTLAVADPQSGRTFVFDHLDLDADAGSFTGPFKVRGAEGAPTRRTKFRLATTTPENGRARLRLVVDETPLHASLDLEGLLQFAAVGTDSLRPSLEGTIALAGHLPRSADPPIAWKLSGPFVADPAHAAIDGGELRLGSDDAGLTLQAKAEANFVDRAKLALALSAKQLDIDRLSGAPADAVKPPPPRLPSLADLESMVGAVDPGFETGVDVAVETATYGGETLSDLHANFGIGGAYDAPFVISADGPGGTHVTIDGRRTSGARLGFSGHVDLDADNLPRAIDWLATVSPTLPWKGSDMPFRAVKFSGLVKADSAAVASDTLAITLDRSILKGAARLTFATGDTAPKLTTALTADALDLDALPSLDGLRGSSGLLDLDLRLDAKAIKVSQVGEGTLDAGRIHLALTKIGRHLDLEDFRADDLNGATIGARGTVDGEHAALKATIDATHLDAAAALVRQMAPGRIAEVLVDRAAVLAPARLTIDAAFVSAPDGALAPSHLAVAGTLGATRIDATASPNPAGGATDETLSASFTAPEGSALLAQLGVPALPMTVIGPSRISLSASGRSGQPLATTVAARFGTTALDLQGRFDMTTPSGTGALRLRSADVTPLLQALAIAFPDMTGRLPADVRCEIAFAAKGVACRAIKGQVAGIGATGMLRYQPAADDRPALTGALAFDRLSLSSLVGLALGSGPAPPAGAIWSKEPLAIGLIDPPRSAVALTAKALELLPGVRATMARLDLDVAQNLVSLGGIDAELSGGRIKGGVTLRRDGHQATLEGQVALDRVGVHTAAVDTTLTAKLDFAGGGASSYALVGSLAGSGEAKANTLVVPGADPAALPKVFDDVENDALAVDQDAVIRALEEAAKGPLAADGRPFALSLAAGVLHFDPKAPDSVVAGPVSSKIDAAFDLTRLSLEAHIDQTLDALPKNWSGPPPQITITLAGPTDRPVRSFDVSNFLNAVAARALARETARIEAYEFDIRERAIFNTRLLSERRREEERIKAEDDARRAEEERRARAEAARLDRLRKEQAEKAAKEKAAKERAAKEKAARDQASREAAEKAARDAADRAAREREPPAPDRAPSSGDAPSAPGPQAPPPPPPVNDPSTLGRY